MVAVAIPLAAAAVLWQRPKATTNGRARRSRGRRAAAAPASVRLVPVSTLGRRRIIAAATGCARRSHAPQPGSRAPARGQHTHPRTPRPGSLSRHLAGLLRLSQRRRRCSACHLPLRADKPDQPENAGRVVQLTSGDSRAAARSRHTHPRTPRPRSLSLESPLFPRRSSSLQRGAGTPNHALGASPRHLAGLLRLSQRCRDCSASHLPSLPQSELTSLTTRCTRRAAHERRLQGCSAEPAPL